MDDLLPIEFDAYYLTAPHTFKKKTERITAVPEGYTILKTVKTGICASDLHYYLGYKSKEKLKQRLPLILLHEGVCIDIMRGNKVVPIAVDLTDVDTSYIGRENIYPSAKYMGATAHGMARQYFIYPESLLIPISTTVDDDIATLVEPLSIVLKAIKDINIHYSQRVAIIGDGGLAFLLALMLHFYSNLSPRNLTVYGVHDEKLAQFKQFGNSVNTRHEYKAEPFDVIFEVVGGSNIQSTLNLSFELAQPGSTIGIVGVSDDLPQINMNHVVNKGITIKGLTRSTYSEYVYVADFFKNLKVQSAVKKFIYPKQTTIKSSSALKESFDVAATLSTHGRVIVDWS